MHACQFGHLDVAKWLYEVGAAEDIRTKNHKEGTPLQVASSHDQHSTVYWLILQGAANDESSGHVDAGILQSILNRHSAFSKNLATLLKDYWNFVCLVLPACYIASQTPSLLPLIGGHGGRVVRLVADFVGVARGRQLRNAREALGFLL